MITFEIKSEREITFTYSCKSHRRGRKAYRYWHPNGKKEYEEYYINGELHRLNSPSSTAWYPNGQKMSEHHYINGIFQSFKRWNKQGKLL